MPEGHSAARDVVTVPAPAGPPLLASRLAPAAPPEPVVLRPRLARALDTAVAGSLTLVRAPAGWGKTTLLASWCRAAADAGTPVPAWVSVEAGDDADRLWAYLAAALRAATDPAAGAGPPVPDRAPRPDQLELLAAALAARERPLLLVLDDLDRVTDPAALTGLEFLLRHTDQRLRLVAAGRAEVSLAVHRLRLAGEVTELGPNDLAFTGDEIADLLTAHGVALPLAAVRRLRERTDGWPAALRIAAVALRGQPDPARWVERFGADQPQLAGYLREEVLAGLDPGTRDVLRRGAVADALCAGLADTLTGRADTEPVLAGLADGGGLLGRDDSRPPWYRCHPLLTEVLRAELGGLPADEVRDLHLRAAGWYAGNGRPAEGLRHALTAGDWDGATELFVARWPELAPYDRDVPAPAAPAPPPAPAVAAGPELALACAAERAQAGDVEAAGAYLRLAAEYAPALPAPRRQRFLRLVAAVELALARLDDDHDRVRAAAGRLLATRAGDPVPAAAPRADTVGDADVRAVAGVALALVDLAEGELETAGRGFGEALAAAREAGRPRTELVCASRAALLAALRGGLRTAEETARQALALPPCQGWSSQVDCAYAYLALAVVAVHRDQPEEARAHLVPGGAAGAEPVAGAVLAWCRAALAADAGDPGEGERLLAAARGRLADRPAGGLHALLAAAEADLRAARGDLNGARDLLGVAGYGPDPAGPVDAGGARASVVVATARLARRAGDPRAAARLLPDWADADDWPLPVRLDAALLDVVLAAEAGDGRRAGRVLERALDLADAQGFRRAFTRAEPGLRELLAAHLDAGTAHWSTVSDLVRAVDTAGSAPAGQPAAGTLDEPLTEREMTILRYLQSILSNVEIAAELSLSVNTVKTHVRNIYRKLDATRRRDAVRRARELHLI
ncbi:LuxR family transcriptional regulator, maltose regulon positive regulatory protein [Micromonospora nigra]|uniref:LuxR family transcriptional regulator, maltose regulon positive regulatory protein n=2 Tax=Micromonospora nigra TaxID=145857 RepID=A0A1C6RIS0_9ACTN|nr:LuxR C-terminal-related transcriptional regulator [Micromonospora nigra]SCL16943.1 LuxR family transcriptional regulator, maltose regulon positive regulatory protein [Micromonospora nigra]